MVGTKDRSLEKMLKKDLIKSYEILVKKYNDSLRDNIELKERFEDLESSLILESRYHEKARKEIETLKSRRSQIKDLEEVTNFAIEKKANFIKFDGFEVSLTPAAFIKEPGITQEDKNHDNLNKEDREKKEKDELDDLLFHSVT